MTNRCRFLSQLVINGGRGHCRGHDPRPQGHTARKERDREAGPQMHFQAGAQWGAAGGPQHSGGKDKLEESLICRFIYSRVIPDWTSGTERDRKSS